jgi:hypothetical protein
MRVQNGGKQKGDGTLRFLGSLAASLFVMALILFGNAATLSAQTAGIVDIRVGEHVGYDRLVMQLERPVAVLRHAGEPTGEVIIELQARPLLAHQTLDTALSRLGRVQIDSTRQGTRVLIATGPRLVRAFLLQDPDRLVIDCGDPDLEPFDVPPGVRPVPVVAPPVELAEPEPDPTETISQGPEPGTLPLAQEADQPEAEDVPEPGATLPPEPEPSTEPGSVPAEIEPSAEPEPAPAEVQSAPKLLGLEEHSTLLSVGLAVLFAVLLGAAGIFAVRLWRRMPRGPDPAAELGEEEIASTVIPADTIMPEEFEAGGDRLGLLEKRIDDEVRARMQLEERVIQLQEELKVLRDRLHRAARAKEGQRPGL